jgi:peptidoglycan/LPS O-acetylase OafA/YrhL
MKSAPGNTSEKIHPLTSMRFFAALYVVLYHTLGNLAVGRFLPGVTEIVVPSQANPNFGSRFISLGLISVSFFFLLSGYILGVVYLRKGLALDTRKFLVARFARIYPLFFITLVIDSPFMLAGLIKTSSLSHAVFKTAASFIGGAIMIHAWFIRLRGIDNPNWSLSVETLFYLSFPIIGAVLWKLRGIARWSTALLIYFVGQTAVFVVTPHFALVVVKYYPLLHLSTFALGILLASWQFTPAPGKPSSEVSPWQSYLVLAFCVAAFAAVVQFSPHLPFTNVSDGLLAPIFMGVIWALSSSTTFVSRLLSASWLVVLGEASFGLYLLHIPVLHIFELFHSVTHPAAYFTYLALTIALSVLSFYYVETPIRIWILARFHTRPRESVEAASIAQ